jgi:hypothetical protein
MSTIDDPLEAVKRQWKEPPNRTIETIPEVTGKLFPFVGTWKSYPETFFFGYGQHQS